MKQSNEWTYMPQMTPIVALAALFHDWGKEQQKDWGRIPA